MASTQHTSRGLASVPATAHSARKTRSATAAPLSAVKPPIKVIKPSAAASKPADKPAKPTAAAAKPAGQPAKGRAGARTKPAGRGKAAAPARGKATAGRRVHLREVTIDEETFSLGDDVYVVLDTAALEGLRWGCRDARLWAAMHRAPLVYPCCASCAPSSWPLLPHSQRHAQRDAEAGDRCARHGWHAAGTVGPVSAAAALQGCAPYASLAFKLPASYVPSPPPPPCSEAEEEDCPCIVCGGRDVDERTMLECDRCLAGCHLACLTPPLDEVPEVRGVRVLGDVAGTCAGPQLRGQRRQGGPAAAKPGQLDPLALPSQPRRPA